MTYSERASDKFFSESSSTIIKRLNGRGRQLDYGSFIMI